MVGLNKVKYPLTTIVVGESLFNTLVDDGMINKEGHFIQQKAIDTLIGWYNNKPIYRSTYKSS